MNAAMPFPSHGPLPAASLAGRVILVTGAGQ